MPKLANAPLIETIFELRWGAAKQMPDGAVAITFGDDEAFFIGRFHAEAKQRGFEVTERVNTMLQGAPHVVTYRFRKAPNAWPCYQVGLGILTVNQVNDGYDWSSFKADTIAGLEMLSRGHPDGIESLTPLGIELRYQDAFLFEPGESPTQFLQNKLNFSFSVPKPFLNDASIGAAEPQGTNLSFQVKTKTRAVVVVTLNEGTINGKHGFVMETAVRSADEFRPDRFSLDDVGEWLEQAHAIQRVAFQSFINPVYMKSFK